MDKLAQDIEEQLITRSQQGDVDAFNQLVLFYQQFVYNTIFRLLGDYDTASDLTQDTFVAALRAIRTYRGGASFRAWLLRIGTNLAHDYWRRLQRHPTLSINDMVEEEQPHTIQSLASAELSENPEEAMLTRELQELLQRGLETLSLEQRTAVVLCDIQGLAYEEVAQITRTALGTVRSRISRGRSRLRDYLNTHKELLPRDYRLSNKAD